MSEYEKSADELESASHLQEQLNLAGRRAVEAALAPQTHPEFNGADCIGCGESLPPVRLAHKRIRCAECQTEIERLEKMRRR